MTWLLAELYRGAMELTAHVVVAVVAIAVVAERNEMSWLAEIVARKASRNWHCSGRASST